MSPGSAAPGESPSGVPATTPNPAGAAPATPPANPGDGDQRPAWLPEKFKGPEDLAKAYAELEKAQSSAAAKQAQDAAARQQGKVQKAIAEKGIDLNELSSEYAENGKLSAKTYARLAEAGLSDTVIDQFVAGQKALADRMIQSAFDLAGGEQSYSAMTEWAKANWDAETLAHYNKMVTNGSEAELRLAVRGLLADWIDATGDEPDLVQGGAGAGAVDVYASQAEYLADIRDPRYQSGDPAFHKKVDAKLARSRF